MAAPKKTETVVAEPVTEEEAASLEPAVIVHADGTEQVGGTLTPEKEVAAEADIEVIVALTITGLRNGEPWPAVGERVTLPADEAATYLRTGIVKAIED